MTKQSASRTAAASTVAAALISAQNSEGVGTAPISGPAAETTEASSAPVESTPPVADAKPAKTPRVKRAKGEIGGPAFDKLVAAGASLVRIAATGQLHNVVLSNLSPVVPVAELPTIVPPLVGGWSQFDTGYLMGGHASYDAAAVDICSKKAKTNPAFTYARRNEDGSISLFGANGEPWVRADKEGRSQTTFDRAMQAAIVAFAPAPEVAG